MSHRDARIEHYLDQVCRQVKAREVHPDLRDEIGSHLDEIFYERQQEGDTPEQAASYAIAQMGDPLTIGKSMHRLHRHRIHWGVVLGVLALFSVGLLLMWIYATRLAVPTYEGLYVNYLAYSGIGIIGLFFCLFFDYRKWKKAAWGLYILIIVLLWINPWLSSVTNIINSFRYISLPLGFSLDLSTAAAWILPLSIGAIMLDKLSVEVNKQSVLAYLGLMALPVHLFIQLNDWVRALLFAMISVLMFAWITRKWILSLLAVISAGVIATIIMFISGSYGPFERFRMLPNWMTDPYGQGYYNYNILHILKSAGWWGNGLNIASNQFRSMYYSYPGVALIDVFGWTAGIALLIGVIWFVVTMLKASLRVKDKFGQMIIVVITLMFMVQMVYSLALTTGWVPIFSITFPVIGYGGSRLIFEYAMIGLLLGVYRRKDTISLAYGKEGRLTESK